jgi:uncharacterized protein (DUF342 family)
VSANVRGQAWITQAPRAPMNPDAEQSAIEVKIDQGATVATVIIPAGLNPTGLEVSSLATLVRQRGIVTDAAVADRLQKIVEAYRRKPQRLEVVVARAVAAVDGRDGRVEWMKGLDPTAGPAAVGTQDDSGAVDYYNQVSYISVTKGTHVATLHEPTLGEDGRDVTGRPIKAKPGRHLRLRIDPSLDQDDGGRVIARLDGILECERGMLKVSRLFEIRGSVDFGTGNVDFDGTVVVREGVRDRFKVTATGDVVVAGLIEAAEIDCGHDLRCRQGMAGKGRGRLVVGGDAAAGYLDDVKGRITGNLTVQREMINCDLQVGGNLICDQGRVIGGQVAVSGRVQIAALGCAAETETTLLLTPPARDPGASDPADPTSAPAEITVVDVLIHKAIYPGVRLMIGDVVVKFDMALKGPIRIGRHGEGQLYFSDGAGSKRALSSVAKVVGRAA